MPRLRVGHIWVAGTSALIAFLAYSPQLSGLVLGAPSWQLVLFNLSVGLIWFNYALCVRTDPGGIPKGWQPGVELEEMRYCKKCEVPKPPRAHHCRHCRRCILRYDHHCPWIDNCVGHANYPHFLRFLFWVVVSCSAHVYLVTYQALDEANLTRDPRPWEIALLVANYVLCIPVLVCIGLFGTYHFWNLATNITTIEGSEIEKVQKMAKRGKIRPTTFPFNIGILHNITSVLGHTPAEWLLYSRPSGDGLSWPCVPGSKPLTWPPRDPYDSLRQTWELEAEVTKSRYPPYHPKYHAMEDEDEVGDYREDDDDVPLAEIRQRSVRLRRGSEGFEVRPIGVIADLSGSEEDAGRHESIDSDDSDWEELYQKRLALYDSESD